MHMAHYLFQEHIDHTCCKLKTAEAEHVFDNPIQQIFQLGCLGHCRASHLPHGNGAHRELRLVAATLHGKGHRSCGQFRKGPESSV